jgi:hypothetical protein
MRKQFQRTLAMAAVVIAGILVSGSIDNNAQDKPKRETFQAQAMGESTQLGQSFNVTVIIEEYSSPADQQVLAQAFEAAGSKGLYNALNKMHSKGHIAITGTLGYDVSYIREIPTPNGRKIRLVTNRPITFGEAWTDSRSSDYNLSALEFDLTKDDKGKTKGKGTLIPACQFKIDKEKQVQIEAYQNPWRLVDVLDR